MSTRYVWGRYNTVWEIKDDNAVVSQASTIQYFTNNRAESLADIYSDFTINSNGAITGGTVTETLTNLRNLTAGQYFRPYMQIFDSWDGPPIDTLYILSYQYMKAISTTEASLSIYNGTGEHYRQLTIRNFIPITTQRAKGAANGTVSNASSGAYQLDTSVDSLL